MIKFCKLIGRIKESVRKIAKDLEIGEKTLYNWLRDYRIKHNLEILQTNIKKSTSIESIEEENRRLRRENALLKKEKEIFKKAFVSSQKKQCEVRIYKRLL